MLQLVTQQLQYILMNKQENIGVNLLAYDANARLVASQYLFSR